jgi:hypothetical protein
MSLEYDVSTFSIHRIYEVLTYVGNCSYFWGPLTDIQATMIYKDLLLDLQMASCLHGNKPLEQDVEYEFHGNQVHF